MILTGGGDIDIISVASAGEVAIDETVIPDESPRKFGEVSITDSRTLDKRRYANVDATGLGGGKIFIKAGRLMMDAGFIFADTIGEKNGRGITIHTADSLDMENGGSPRKHIKMAAACTTVLHTAVLSLRYPRAMPAISI